MDPQMAQPTILAEHLRTILNSGDAQDQHPQGVCICVDPDTNQAMALNPEEALTGTRCVFVEVESGDEAADDDELASTLQALAEFQNPSAASFIESDIDDNEDDDDDDD